MNKELCFILDDEELYLEQSLVDYNGIPIFFICRSESSVYIALCTDIDDFNYIVIKSNMEEIMEMFNKKIPMRSLFENKSFFWSVISGDNIENDTVYKKDISLIDVSLLPFEDAYYEAVTDEVKAYISHIGKDAFYSNAIGSILGSYDLVCSEEYDFSNIPNNHGNIYVGFFENEIEQDLLMDNNNLCIYSSNTSNNVEMNDFDFLKNNEIKYEIYKEIKIFDYAA